MIRRFLLYTAKAVCFERNEPLDVHQYAFGFVSSNLHLSGATSGWLLTKVSAKRYGVPESAERNFRLEICQGGCKKVLYFQKKCFIHEGKRNMKADFVLYFFPFPSCILSQKRL